jgi:hypothetical protein
VGETSFPYAGGGGVTDARYEALMAEVTGSGRIADNPTSGVLSQKLVYADSTGRQVKVRGSQAALVRGFRWETDASGLLQPIEANTSGQPRIDLAVLRLHRETFTVSFRIVKGTPATTPTVPAATQTIATNGVWELPVATIRVASSTASGLPSIGDTDVTALDNFLAAPSRTGHSSRRPPAAWGGLWTEYDTGRTYVGNGGAWNLIGETDSLTQLSPASGWAAPGNLYARRRNGLTYFQGLLQLTASDKAAGTDLTICTVPVEFRPTHDLALLGYVSGGNLVRCYLDAQTGRLFVSDYAMTFKKGWAISVHPATWVSR